MWHISTMRSLNVYLVLYAFNYLKWIKIPVPSFFLYWNTLLYEIHDSTLYDRKSSSYNFSHSLPPTGKNNSSFTGDLQNKRDMNDSPPFDLPLARTNWTPPWRASAGAVGIGRFDSFGGSPVVFLEQFLLWECIWTCLEIVFFFRNFCFKVFCPRKMLIVFHHLIVITLVLISVLMPVKSLGS